ncbi:MAG: leucyl aminopeptidase [Actinobacteria bacterium]|nr:leucyl aminopeptidase [Actinomycetota bacterium]
MSLKDLVAQSPLLGKEFKGKLGEVIAAPTLGKIPAKQVLFVGLGNEGEADVSVARKAGATVARKAGGARSVATTIPSGIDAPAGDAAGAFAEGVLLASYRFERYKAEQTNKPNRISSVTFAGGVDAKALKERVARAQAVAEGTALARDLVNTPAGDLTPETFAAEARAVAKNGLKITVLDEKQLKARKFGGLLGVGAGSVNPPRMIELRYDATGAKRTVALVGKGITFDSGGINLKPSDGLDWMKMDMGGGAAVLGTMLTISKLKPKVNVRAYICSAENMPGGRALKPGDVITQYGGKTVEIGNTDAEGRLVMADGIVLAKEHGADVVIDIATLTGAMMIAVGHHMFGVIGEPREETRKMVDAAERAGEPAWELPLFKGYRDVIESEIADLRNISNRNVGGGAIVAGLFLKEFAGDTPWIHLDIAGPAKSDADRFEVPKGATGVGVRTLVEYLLGEAGTAVSRNGSTSGARARKKAPAKK